LEIRPSEDLAYWVGVVQSDGCFRTQTVKRTGRKRKLISLNVGIKSLCMSDEFRRISETVFNRKIGVFKEKNRDVWSCVLSVNSLVSSLDDSGIVFGDPPTPPLWSLQERSLFGSYLAGIIDGDGDVRIKRKSYPQCAIRITNGSTQIALSDSIRKILGCSVNLYYREKRSEIDGRKIFGHENILEFYVSSKNMDFLRKFVTPHIRIKYKKGKIENYINSKSMASVA